MPAVFLVKPGSIERDGYGRILDARSSVTLVISGQQTIIVDSGLRGEEELIRRELVKLGIEPEEVKSIVNTHSHPDHCGNNYMFSSATILKGKEGDFIAPGVRIMATPGHCMESISVVVEVDNAASQIKTIVISGDALPTFSNFLRKVPPALHVDRDLAIASMQRIIALSDIVVPGHDFPFSVRRREYVLLPSKM